MLWGVVENRRAMDVRVSPRLTRYSMTAVDATGVCVGAGGGALVTGLPIATGDAAPEAEALRGRFPDGAGARPQALSTTATTRMPADRTVSDHRERVIGASTAR